MARSCASQITLIVLAAVAIVLMAAVLFLRPQGLFPARGR